MSLAEERWVDREIAAEAARLAAQKEAEAAKVRGSVPVAAAYDVYPAEDKLDQEVISGADGVPGATIVHIDLEAANSLEAVSRRLGQSTPTPQGLWLDTDRIMELE